MFEAQDLVDIAKRRFGETKLRERMRSDDASDADDQLLRIAQSVLSRVQAAASTSVGWPFPGTWPDGSFDGVGEDISNEPYTDVWPENLLQNALDLFQWRTVAGLEQATDNQRRVGVAAEAYFVAVGSGEIGLGLASTTEAGSPGFLAARNRDGSSNIGSVPDQDNALDIFTGESWDV